MGLRGRTWDAGPAMAGTPQGEARGGVRPGSAPTDEEAAAEIRVWSSEWRSRLRKEADEEAAETPELAELAALEQSVLARPDIFATLRRRYKIEPAPVLELLRMHRFRWRFGNTGRPFEEMTVEEIEAAGRVFREATRLLDVFGPFLQGEWLENLRALYERLPVIEANGATEAPTDDLADAEKLRADEEDLRARFEALGFRLTHRRDGTLELKAPDKETGRAVEAALADADLARDLAQQRHLRELLDTARVVLDGARVEPEMVLSNLPQRIADTRNLYLLAAQTIARFDWRRAEDHAGRSFFRKGPRRKLWIEADCARALVAHFKHETDHVLYDYVGDLLVATFPSLVTWTQGAKRLRDRVKDLLKDYPGPLR